MYFVMLVAVIWFLRYAVPHLWMLSAKGSERPLLRRVIETIFHKLVQEKLRRSTLYHLQKAM